MYDFDTGRVYSICPGANLRNAPLAGVLWAFDDLRGTDLRGANLRGNDLAQISLDGAWYDRRTRWPTGFNALARGARLVE